MVLHFKVSYRTQYGQSVWVVYAGDHAEANETAISLQYLDEEHWQGKLELPSGNHFASISYRFQIRESDKVVHEDLWHHRNVLLPSSAVRIDIYADWQHRPSGVDVFQSRAFTKVLLDDVSFLEHQYTSQPTHHIHLNAPLMAHGLRVCIVGDGDFLGNWKVTHPLLFNRKNDIWTLALDLSGQSFPLEYKLGLYDETNEKFVAYENGNNRIFEKSDSSAFQQVMQLVADFSPLQWRGTGLNVQLSSLKTQSSWGVGDFTDLKLLIDWCRDTSIKMIQLLPINDTISTYTKKDSYPYSAVSAFAQHPIFLDIKEMAAAHEFELNHETFELAANLNANESLLYDEVVRLKLDIARDVFSKASSTFARKKNYKTFFIANEHWLKPYAVFSVLRDVFKTSDTASWPKYGVYDEHDIETLIKPKSKYYKDIQFYFFLQYHLHCQLCNAVDHAHKAGVIMKGDLPIGVGRHSVDTWMNPGLFHMDMQAGAPPDAFAVKGQNWSFPTYHWEQMKLDGYAWWRKRLQHMSQYFDATRIDHVLGFFRIWSIPLAAIDGDFGYFVPAIPFAAEDFNRAGINFDESRFCNPYITDQILHQRFGQDVEWVRATFFDGIQFKVTFNTQRKIQEYADEHGLQEHLKRQLFDLLSEVILWRDAVHEGRYHFRISMHHTRSFQDLPESVRHQLDEMYVDYFYRKQNTLWHESALEKLDAIQQSSDMMICAEDLGMVPEMVEQVLQSRQMLALQVQRMPKQSGRQFSHPADAPYLSVVTPSTHDMSTIREWWEEDSQSSHHFYKDQLGHSSKPPYFCEPHVASAIIKQHLQSPAMWSVFLLQDLLAMDETLRRIHPSEERINIPADPNHFWNYRMHLNIETLISSNTYNESLRRMIADNGRN